MVLSIQITNFQFCKKFKHTFILWFVESTPTDSSKRKKSICPQKTCTRMFTVTFSHDSQIIEIIFTKRKIEKKQIEIYNEVLLRNRNDWTTEIYKMTKSQK